jgi:hypothetical protein
MREYANRNGIPLTDAVTLTGVKNSIVCCLSDYLEPDVVAMLKNNGNKIVGFSVTDSSWVSQCCREAKHLQNIDLMFMLTGIQKVNEGHEMIVKPDFTIGLEKRTFLPGEDWEVFNRMRLEGRLQSLPYVHAERQAHVEARPYNQRSQKVLMRGGHHMRRFILALKLIEIDRLDINSGFVTTPYFQDDMNPQFRYCDECRETWRMNKRYPWNNHTRTCCTNEHARTFPPNLSDLGAWNNKCPQSFYDAAHSLAKVDPAALALLLNARWLPQREHLEMLARITFTSDLKWLFSIYAAQRFWDAASVGCINVLPARTADQDYFPVMNPHEHYLYYSEELDRLGYEFEIGENEYNVISKNAKELYDSWMRPSDYIINTNLLRHIFSKIEEHTA